MLFSLRNEPYEISKRQKKTTTKNQRNNDSSERQRKDHITNFAFQIFFC